MEIEFDPAKDAINRAKHGVSLAYGAKAFDDAGMITAETTRIEDGERRFRAIGVVDGKLWTVVHVTRGEAVRMISVRRSNDGEERAYRATR